MHPPAIAALFFLCGVAFAAPFSHKLHAPLVPKCESCHASIAASTRASDNNLPKIEACAACHEQRTIPAPRATTVTLFNHQKHLALGHIAPVILAAIRAKSYLASPLDPTPLATLEPQLTSLTATTANAACLACHHDATASEAPSRAMYANMPDCLVCHPKIEAPYSCELCHSPGKHLQPASHTPGFIDRHSSNKQSLDKPSCLVCHGKNFQCQGCH